MEGAHSVAVINSVSAVAIILDHLRGLQPGCGMSLAFHKKLAHAELYRIAETLTAYGTVCVHSEVQGKSGPLEVFHTNPFALLALATDKSMMFRKFMASIVAQALDRILTVCFYLDKATPGMHNRHNNGRAAQCIYFTFLEFPHWFLSRRNGWIPFAYLLVDDQQAADLTDSMLVRFLVRIFDSAASEHAFGDGFAVKGPDGTSIIIRARRIIHLADWEQQVKTFNIKGYNGTVPCGICRNVLGKCRFFDDDPYFLHVHSSRVERMDKHTPQSYTDIVNDLRHLAAHGTVANLKQL